MQACEKQSQESLHHPCPSKCTRNLAMEKDGKGTVLFLFLTASGLLVFTNQMFTRVTRELSQAAHAMINIIMNAELAWAN